MNSVKFIKENKRKLIETYASSVIYQPSPYPLTIFMAGSPGAGKTEFSKRYIEILESNINQKHPDDNFKIVRIDADDIRRMIPEYNGSNSYLFQDAVSVGVNKLYDYVLNKKLNVLVDGTFSSDKYAIENISRALKRNRIVEVSYIYQDPIMSWKLTRARERKEGRNVPLEVFIEDFFKARENVNMVKMKFGDKISINLIKKDYETNKYEFEINVPNIDNYLEISYTYQTLTEVLKSI